MEIFNFSTFSFVMKCQFCKQIFKLLRIKSQKSDVFSQYSQFCKQISKLMRKKISMLRQCLLMLHPSSARLGSAQIQLKLKGFLLGSACGEFGSARMAKNLTKRAVSTSVNCKIVNILICILVIWKILLIKWKYLKIVPFFQFLSIFKANQAHLQLDFCSIPAQFQLGF